MRPREGPPYAHLVLLLVPALFAGAYLYLRQAPTVPPLEHPDVPVVRESPAPPVLMLRPRPRRRAETYPYEPVTPPPSVPPPFLHAEEKPTWTLQGRLMDQEGRPLRGVSIYASVRRARGQYRPGLGFKTYTDQTGRFRFDRFAHRSCRLYAHPGNDMVVAPQRVHLPLKDTLTLTAEPAGTVTGYVEDARGNPVAGVRVVANTDVAQTWEYARAWTDERGAFRLTWLLNRTYTVCAFHSVWSAERNEHVGSRTQTLQIEPGSVNVRLRLAPERD